MGVYRGIGTTDTLGDVTGATITEEVQVATAGQTVFTLAVNEYTVGAGNLVVFVNGVRQPSTAYTETGTTGELSSTVTFNTAELEAGDQVFFIIGEIVSTSAVVGKLQVPVVTVAELPPASVNIASKYQVTDATATTFASIVAGSGANIVPVYSDGTNWLIG